MTKLFGAASTALLLSVFACLPTLAVNVPSFQGTSFDPGFAPGSMAIADFNGDGRMDLAFSTFDSTQLHILLQNNSGGFSESSTYEVGGEWAVIVAADFNHDGKPDIATKGDTYLGVFLGNGNGTFSRSELPATLIPGGPYTVLAADFTGDSNTDVLVCYGDTSDVFRGTGSGTFVREGYLPANCIRARSTTLKTQDGPNNDMPDLIGTGFNNGFEIDDKGTTRKSLGLLWAFTLGDFDGDGLPDMVTWEDTRSTILGFHRYDPLYLGHPTNPYDDEQTTLNFFRPINSFPAGAGGFLADGHSMWSTMDSTDLNFDGALDFVVYDRNTADFEAVTGNGHGDFDTPVLFGQFDGAFGENAVADMNGDGAPDVVVSSKDHRVTIYRNTTIQTPVGQDATVVVNNTQFTFDNVTSGGTTTVTPIDPATAGDVPGGFALANVAFEVNTTATFNGSVTSCFKVTTVNDEVEFLALRVLHSEGGSLVDRTVSHNYTTRTICAETTSFSPFYLARAGNFVESLFDRSKAFKAGSTVPIKLRLLNTNGVNISSSTLPLYVKGLRKIAASTASTVSDPGNSNPDYQFRFTDGNYQYNLKTTGLQSGKYVLSFYVGSNVNFSYNLTFDLR